MDDNVRCFISAGAMGEWFCRRFMGNYNLPMFDFHLVNSAYTGQELIDSLAPEKNLYRSERFLNFCWRFLRAPKVALADRIFVNQCGVDLDMFSEARKQSVLRSELIRKYGLSDNSKLLLYAGRISPEKNIRLLPTLMEILKNDSADEYHLLVAGSGPSLEWLASEAQRRAPGRITLVGQISDKTELADLFANCDVFVHPNPREPFGITPLEAMASGVPVVAPNSGGLLSYAHHRNAWLSEADPASFARAIRHVFSCTDTRLEKIRNGIETASGYSWKVSTDNCFALYDRMFAEFTGHRDLYDYSEPVDTRDFVSRFTTC